MPFNQTNHHHSLTRRGVLTLGLLSTLLLLLLLSLNSAQLAAAKPLGQRCLIGDCPTHPADKAALVALYNNTGSVLPWDINSDPCGGSYLGDWEGMACIFDSPSWRWRVYLVNLPNRGLTGTIPAESRSPSKPPFSAMVTQQRDSRY